MDHKIIDGKKHAQVIKEKVQVKVAALREVGWKPRLISIDIGESPAARLFIKHQQQACEEVGIEYENRNYPSEITQREVLAMIHALNALFHPALANIRQDLCHDFGIACPPYLGYQSRVFCIRKYESLYVLRAG